MSPSRVAAASLASAATALVLMASAAVAAPKAQGADLGPATERLLSLFKSVCFDTVPDMGAIEAAAATDGWQELKGVELQTFKPSSGTPKALRAWRVKEGPLTFAVAYGITPISSDIASKLPAFAGGDAYSCSVLPVAADYDRTAATLAGWVGRPATKEFDQGPLKGRSWVGVTAAAAVFLQQFRPANGGKGGLLSITMIPKP